MQPWDTYKSGRRLGLPMLPAMVGGVLDRKTRGVTTIVGPLDLGGIARPDRGSVGEQTEPPE